VRKLSPEEVAKLGLDAATPADAKPLRKLSPEEVAKLGLETPKAPAADGTASPSFWEALAAKHAGTAGDYLGAAFQSSLPSAFKEGADREALYAQDFDPSVADADFKQALSENRQIQEQAGKKQPIASAIGNVTNAVFDPLTLAAVPKAAALTAKIASPLVRGGTLAALLATPAAAGKSFIETGDPLQAGKAALETAPKAFAAGAAPLIMGPAMVLQGLLGDGSPEQRLTEGLSGLTMTAGGGAARLGNKATALEQPLRTLAEDSQARASGVSLADIRNTGGLDAVRSVFRRMLDRGHGKFGGNAESLRKSYKGDLDATGGEIGLDRADFTARATPELLQQMHPEQRAADFHQGLELTPETIARVGPQTAAMAQEGIIPRLHGIEAKRGQIPHAVALADDIRAAGRPAVFDRNGATLAEGPAARPSFEALAEQNTALGQQAYKANNKYNPSPNAEVLQDAYMLAKLREENLAQQTGSPRFPGFLDRKDVYTDLSTALGSTENLANRSLANRGLSLSTNVLAASQKSPVKMGMMALANKLGLERGNSALAVTADKLSKGLGRVGREVTSAAQAGNAELSEDDKAKFVEWLLSRGQQ
jgi:hypothetical protein